MKNYNNEGSITRLNGKPLKVTKEETFRNYYEEELVRHNRKMKKLKDIALAVLLAGVIALNGYGLYKYFNQPEKTPNSDYAYGFDIDETDWCEPITVVRYVAPEGFIRDGAHCYKYDENGEKIVINATAVYEIAAPEGYVLIGDKCFKLNETEEKTKGR